MALEPVQAQPAVGQTPAKAEVGSAGRLELLAVESVVIQRRDFVEHFDLFGYPESVVRIAVTVAAAAVAAGQLVVVAAVARPVAALGAAAVAAGTG